MTLRVSPSDENSRPDTAVGGDVAIIGMACMYPRALDLKTFWRNIVSGVDAISELPSERFPSTFYDPDSAANDRTYCGRGGFLGVAVPFDPLQFGIMPVVTEGGDPEQFLALHAAREALKDAGYDPDHMEGKRTEVIIGRGNYANRALSTAQHHVSVVNEVLEALKAVRPDCTEAELAAVRKELVAGLPRFGPDNAASLVPNFTTGRIANRFDCMGSNFTVDAACASSLVALDLGTRNLLSRKCDLALIGGAFIISDLTHIAVLTQVQALSKRSQIRPFDQDADGTIMGEGVGILVLKRLHDARQNGDRIYAVVKGVGTSSDGRGLGLLAPRVEGEELALRRAYEMAGIDPATIGLIEAHGTGTPTGDATEIQALTRVFGTRNPDVAPHIGIGTVKSMIGHALPASGAAGLIKTALALYHKTLPPTLHCEQPNPNLAMEQTPFYVNTATRTWIHGGEHPRRAGVSAFGFGGANAHAILEEYPDAIEDTRPSLLSEFPSEVCVLSGSDRGALLRNAQFLTGYLASHPGDSELRDISYTLNTTDEVGPERLAIVAESVDDLRKKLDRACARLADPQCEKIKDAGGIYYFSQPLACAGKLALVFPGEGAQYIGMLGDVCRHFPVARSVFDRADRIASLAYVVPPPWPEERERAERRLWSTVSGAVHAVLTANVALYSLFQKLGFKPDSVMGHSSGDFAACLAAGIFSEDERTLDRLSRLWHAYDTPGPASAREGLLAVGASAPHALAKLGDLAANVVVAMDNCPHQAVLAGPADAIERARERMLASNIICEQLPFGRAYHTEAFASQLGPVRESLNDAPLHAAKLPIYSCTTASLYPADPGHMRQIMIEHWCRPVRFQETIQQMYADGVRLFLELGPRGNLTAFIDDILRGQPYVAVCADSQRRDGVTQLNHTIALLTAHGVSLDLGELYVRRSPRRIDFSDRTNPRQTQPKGVLALSTIQFRLPSRPITHERSTTAHAEGAKSVPPTTGNGAASMAAREPAAAPAAQEWTGADPRFLPHAPAPASNLPLATTAALDLGAAAHTGVADTITDDPMITYLQTLEQFLTVQQSVMEAWLSPGATNACDFVAAPATLDAPDTGPSDTGDPANGLIDADPYPLLGVITSYVAGQELQAERSLSLDTDLFLRDHMLGGKVSPDPAVRPLATVPATVSMEIMAEAASALLPGFKVAAIRNFRSSRWINVADQPTTLHITAKRAGGAADDAEVEVTIWSLEPGTAGVSDGDTPAAKGNVLLAANFAPAPAPTSTPLNNARPCRTDAARIYTWLFHGPQFQAIQALRDVWDDGLSADLRTISLQRFLGPRSSESMIIDPVLLDGVGQLSAAWIYEQVPDPGIMFPIQIDEVSFYGPRYRTSVTLPCRLQLHERDYRTVHADMEVVGPDGRLHTRVTGWHHYRIHTPAYRIRMSRDARTQISGEVWDLPVAQLPPEGKYAASLVDGLSEKGSFSMADACAHIVLSRSERERWRALAGPPNRKAQWLLGRAAAKDAARIYLANHYGLELYPSEIEVTTDSAGRPRLTGGWEHRVPIVPALSLAHVGTIGIAIAGGSGPDDYLGIDIERIRPRDSGFMDLAFLPHERAMLESLEEEARWEWVTRFWCAKEAVAKAAGHGLIDGPRGLSVEGTDWATGRLELKPIGKLQSGLPGVGTALVVAYTARTGEFAVASTVCEKAGERS